MQVYTLPAAYERLIHAALAMAVADAQKDQKFRTDEDPRLRRYTTVPDHLVDSAATGTLVVMVGVPNPDDSHADLGDRLDQIAATPT